MAAGSGHLPGTVLSIYGLDVARQLLPVDLTDGEGQAAISVRGLVSPPTLHRGTFAFETVGTVTMRQRVVRDLLVDYGSALARAGFRHLLISNGHGGPGHLVALEGDVALFIENIVRIADFLACVFVEIEISFRFLQHERQPA